MSDSIRHLSSRIHESRLALRALRAARAHLARALEHPEGLATDVLLRRLAEAAPGAAAGTRWAMNPFLSAVEARRYEIHLESLARGETT